MTLNAFGQLLKRDLCLIRTEGDVRSEVTFIRLTKGETTILKESSVLCVVKTLFPAPLRAHRS